MPADARSAIRSRRRSISTPYIDGRCRRAETEDAVELSKLLCAPNTRWRIHFSLLLRSPAGGEWSGRCSGHDARGAAPPAPPLARRHYSSTIISVGQRATASSRFRDAALSRCVLARVHDCRNISLLILRIYRHWLFILRRPRDARAWPRRKAAAMPLAARVPSHCHRRHSGQAATTKCQMPRCLAARRTYH